MQSTYVHIEFAANDPQAAARFYFDLFGWKTEFMQPMDYVTFESQPGLGGGFPKVDGKIINAGDVYIYIATDDIEATLTKIESLGGKTLVPKTEIPNMGWFALFTDPTGNRVGLYTGMATPS